MDAQPLVPILAAIASLMALAIILSRKGSDPVSLPGPPRHWLLGNALAMPKTREWLTFAEWGRLYGMHLNDHQIGAVSLTVRRCHIRAHCLIENIQPEIHCPQRHRDSKRNYGEAICYQF